MAPLRSANAVGPVDKLSSPLRRHTEVLGKYVKDRQTNAVVSSHLRWHCKNSDVTELILRLRDLLESSARAELIVPNVNKAIIDHFLYLFFASCSDLKISKA